jgi:hypothetical protein
MDIFNRYITADDFASKRKERVVGDSEMRKDFTLYTIDNDHHRAL